MTQTSPPRNSRLSLVGCDDLDVAIERATDLLADVGPAADNGDHGAWNAQARSVLAALMHAAALGDTGLTMTDVSRWIASPKTSEEEVLGLLKRSPQPGPSMAFEQFVNANERTQASITWTIGLAVSAACRATSTRTDLWDCTRDALAGCDNLDVAIKRGAELIENSLGTSKSHHRARQILPLLLHAGALHHGATIVNVAAWAGSPTDGVAFIVRGLARSPHRAEAANTVASWLDNHNGTFAATQFVIYLALRTEVDRLTASDLLR